MYCSGSIKIHTDNRSEGLVEGGGSASAGDNIYYHTQAIPSTIIRYLYGNVDT